MPARWRDYGGNGKMEAAVSAQDETGKGNASLEQVIMKSWNPAMGMMEQLSSNLYGRKTAPIIEYVKNGWDADSDDVFVTITPDSIIIEDFGDGMSLDEFDKFLDIGKTGRHEGTSKKGRKFMGRYGIGNIAALAVGDRFCVTTTKEGSDTEIFYETDFKKLADAENDGVRFHQFQSPVVLRKKSDKSRKGTKIEIFGLNDKYMTKQAELVRCLTQDIGKLLPTEKKGLKVFINGRKVPEYLEQFLKGAKSYEMNFQVVDDDGRMYNVKGWFKVAKKALDESESGIFPRVNEERAIKDGHMYGPDSIRRFGTLKNRIYGEFEANFLEDRLGGNRQTYNDDDDCVVKQIYGHIREYMKKLVMDMEAESDSKIDDVVDEVFDRVSSHMDYAFKSIFRPPQVTDSGDGNKEKKKRVKKNDNKPTSPADGGRQTPSPEDADKKPKDRKEVDIGGSLFNIRHYDGGVNGNYVEINETGPLGGEILVNVEHPMYVKARSLGVDALETYVTCSVARTLVDYKVMVLSQGTHVESNKAYDKVIRSLGKIQRG
jgi:hypothetical protein